MTEKRRVEIILIYLSIVAFLVSSLTVLLLPFADWPDVGVSAVGVAIGCLFWMGIVLGGLFYLIAWIRVRNRSGYQKMREQSKPGVISFGRTKPALITDILFVPMLILTLLGTFAVRIPDILMLISMSLTLLTFFLHFVLNGRVFRYSVINAKRSARIGQKSRMENIVETVSKEKESLPQSDEEGD